MVETYGFKMVGLKAAAGATRDLCPYYFINNSAEIFYNPETGRVAAVYHNSKINAFFWGNAGLARTGVADAEKYELVAVTRYPQTMQDIADFIFDYMHDGVIYGVEQ